MQAPAPRQQRAANEAAPELPCRLLDLPAELLVAVASQLAEDDEFAASIACRKLREAVAGTERHTTGVRLSTRIGSAFGSVQAGVGRIVRHALGAKLFTRAVRLGQLEHLRWLRAHGCAGSPASERWRIRAQAQLRVAIWPCCSGRARMAARVTGGRV
jgi:hypothetical protein